MYFILYFQNTFKNYFLKFKILFPKYFSQNTLHNIFSRKPLSFRLSRVTVCQTFLQFLISNYQSNTGTSIDLHTENYIGHSRTTH